VKLEGKVVTLYTGYVKADSVLFSASGLIVAFIDAVNVFGIVDNRYLLIGPFCIPLFSIMACGAGISFVPDIESLAVLEFY
jgi:hypothetical protein